MLTSSWNRRRISN